MRKSKILIIIAIIIATILGFAFEVISTVEFNNQNGISLKLANTSTETAILGNSPTNSSNLYNNHLLDAMEYLGVNIEWLKENNLLYTWASTSPAFLKAGGTGGKVPGYDNLRYPSNVSWYIRYNAGGPYHPEYNINGVSLGDETTAEGLPDIEYFQAHGWPCNAFPNYYYFNYLPNVAGVDTSWMLDDKYFYEFKDRVWWSYPETYCWVNGWREALDRMAVDGLVTRYSSYEMSGLNPNGKDYSWNPADIVQPNVKGETVIATGKSVYEYLAPGDIVIFRKGNGDGTVKLNSHIGIYAGSADGQHYIADLSAGGHPEPEAPFYSSQGRVGFVTTAYYNLGLEFKGDEVDTWYHFENSPTIKDGGKIEIIKKDPNGTLLEGAVFTATDSNGEKYTSRYEGNGKYIIENLPNGEYVIEETKFPEGYTHMGTEKITWRKTISSDTQVISITAENNPLISITVNKKWEDNSNKNGERPKLVKLTLYANGVEKETVEVKGDGDTWTHTFTNLPKYDANKKEIVYTVDEKTENIPSGYDKVVDGLTVINKEVPKTEITVIKKWDDDSDRDGIRPAVVKLTLFADGVEKQTVEVDGTGDTWSYTFKNLIKYNDNGTEIVYTVQEKTENVAKGYEKSEDDSTIINKHIPEKINLKVMKKWDDMNNLDDLRSDSITVKLLANGKDTGKTVTLSDTNNWTAEFTELYKYENQGKVINYTVEEIIVDGYEIGYEKTEQDATIIYTITNKHEPHYEGYVEITGKVWLDGKAGKANEINGTFGEEDTVLKGIKVTLKDANGEQFDVTSTTVTDENGNYIIKVNYDNSQNVYKLHEDANTIKTKLAKAYIEFEYDGVKYTTVANSEAGANTSKAVEDEEVRNSFDNANSKVTSSTNVSDTKVVTAITKGVIGFEEYAKVQENIEKTKREEVIKYCNGNGTYTRTYHNGAWNDVQVKNHTCTNCNGTGHSMDTFEVDVETIKNVNLGLFEREQPDVAIYSDLSKVEVIMNGQKYTYLYNVRSDKFKDTELKVKFQNKDTYTYRRPVNPADIAYIQEDAHNNAMSVLVTYEVKVANLSTTLQQTIHNITNSYDKEYTLNTTGWTVTNGTEFNQATSGELNIVLAPQTESEPIQLTYTVSLDAIKGLLKEEATLNNAVEIEAYSTQYGANTLYAEQRTGGRTNQPYAGYDQNSTPGNAEIFINNDGRLEAAKPEDDTDIAPSFVLCKEDTPKTLSGTIWEDIDNDTSNGERLGNGKYESTENSVQNVKVELYNLNGTIAKLYNVSGESKDAITYTDANGNYSLDGVVTGEYFLKFTYGNETEKVSTIKEKPVNARNYKSTIITDNAIKDILSKEYAQFSETEKMWHITHTDGYSVAVDNMKDRLKVEDLTYSNFEKGTDMTAYTKPFKTQVEFETTGQAQVIDESGNIGISKDLNKLDFGIAERPREDLFVEKTIKYFKITLANGQVLTEGNPNDPDAEINYAKAIGFEQQINSGEAARRALEKQLLVEIDTELMQGAQLEIQYAVKVTNNNEIDYDYGTEADYTDIIAETTENEIDKYITRNPKANYYYYGDKTGLSEIQAVIDFVDYMDNEVIYKQEDTKWKLVEATELFDNGLISEDTYNTLKNNKYNILQNASNSSITLKRNTSFEQDMTANKLLANKEENVFDNNAEIIRIDGKTARTIQERKNGIQVEKTYKPGNYVPSINSDISEQDDDRVKIIITPPTGATNYITTYVIATLIGLIVVCGGVIFIKKKVLTK